MSRPLGLLLLVAALGLGGGCVFRPPWNPPSLGAGQDGGSRTDHGDAGTADSGTQTPGPDADASDDAASPPADFCDSEGGVDGAIHGDGGRCVDSGDAGDADASETGDASPPIDAPAD